MTDISALLSAKQITGGETIVDGVGCRDIGALLGLHPLETPREVIERLAVARAGNEPADTRLAWDLRLGRAIVEGYAADNPELVVRSWPLNAYVTDRDLPFLWCMPAGVEFSPDGEPRTIVARSGGRDFDGLSPDAPRALVAEAELQMTVTGTGYARILVLSADGRLLTWPVTRSRRAVGRMRMLVQFSYGAARRGQCGRVPRFYWSIAERACGELFENCEIEAWPELTATALEMIDDVGPDDDPAHLAEVLAWVRNYLPPRIVPALEEFAKGYQSELPN